VRKAAHELDTALMAATVNLKAEPGEKERTAAESEQARSRFVEVGRTSLQKPG
jgi:hypothetical protein